MPVILEPQKQDCCRLRGNLVQIAGFRPVRVTVRCCTYQLPTPASKREIVWFRCWRTRINVEENQIGGKVVLQEGNDFKSCLVRRGEDGRQVKRVA